MRYNELTYHKANPFYKQDFLPDRAWFNRQEKAYPSQIPSGKDFLPNDGRKHFTNRFNHSEIEQNGVLKSVEKYPYEHRIALDKTYQRSLLTIDIEGASSNTKMNQSIKNKLKARDELARRYNQSVESKQKTEEERRRDVALQLYQSNQERKYQSNQKLNSSRLSSNNDHNYDPSIDNNPERSSPTIKKDLTNEYKRYIMQNSSNKYSKDIPQPQYNQFSRVASYSSRPQHYNEQANHNEQPATYQNYDHPSPRMRSDSSHHNEGVAGLTSPVLSHYKNQFNAEMMKKSEQYQKILQYEEMSRRMMQNPRQIRKSNPTNLSSSFNMAGQSIVSG